MSDALTTPFERSSPVPGVRLVTESMPHVRSASIGFWVDAGSRDEPDELAGAAHLLEHLLFKGTETRSAQDIANAFDAAGGELNAYSAREHTCFYARVLDTDLAMATDVLCDMFHHGALRPEDLESERRVVLEEIRMAADVPEDWVHDVHSEASWPGHALGRAVIGTESSIGSMQRERLIEFYREGYVPDRLVVSAAGSMTHDEVAGLLLERLDPGTAPVRRSNASPPVWGGPNAVYARKGSEQAHVVWGFEGVGREDPDRYALSVMNALYGGGVSSRLFQEVREKRGLAYSVYSGYHTYLETGLFSVYAGMQPDTARQVLEIAGAEAVQIASGEVGAEEVERAKGQVRGGLVLSMDDPGGRMTRLGRSELVHGEVPTVDELLARIDAVSREDVARVAKRIFAGNGSVLACVGPMQEGALDFAVSPLGN